MADHAFHQFKLRLPSELFQQLETAAAEANRSVSAEIVTRLEASFEPASPAASAPDLAALQPLLNYAIKSSLEVMEKQQAAAIKRMEMKVANVIRMVAGEPPDHGDTKKGASK